MKLIKTLLLALAIMIPAFSYALSYKIVAIVNGESISNIQVKDRVNLIISSSGIAPTQESRLKVTKETIEVLINEALQLQEAKAKGVDISEQDVSAAIEDLEKRNRIPSGGFKKFITSKGLSYDAAMSQIKAGIQWKKTVSRFFRAQVLITDAEVEAKKKEFAKIKSKTTSNISEIIIPQEFEDKTSTAELAKKIIEAVKNEGRDFSDLASKYSVGKTAKKGGLVGWVDESKIVEPIGSTVSKTPVGEITEPIYVDNLYVIVKVNDRKVFDPANDSKSIKDALMMEKLEGQSKRYIKELRQKALIERKYKDIAELM